MKQEQVNLIRNKIFKGGHVTKDDYLLMTNYTIENFKYLKNDFIKLNRDECIMLPHYVGLDLLQTDIEKIRVQLNYLKANLNYIKTIGFDYNHLLGFLKDSESVYHISLANNIILKYATFFDEVLYHPSTKCFDKDGYFSEQKAELIYYKNHEEYLRHAMRVENDYKKDLKNMAKTNLKTL